MKVITKSQIYHVSGNCGSEFLNVGGEQGVEMPGTAAGPLPGLGGGGYTQPTKKEVDRLAKKYNRKKITGDGILGGIDKAKQGVDSLAGIFQTGKNVLKGGGKKQAGSSSSDRPDARMDKDHQPARLMDKTTKTLLWVGGGIIAAVIIYLVVKKKKK